jgi:hypothetical protein
MTGPLWTREELVESLFESEKREEEYERKVIREREYQERLYSLLGEMLRKNEMPKAFE